MLFPSSGKMGVELARACRNRGARVTLLLANSPLEIDGVDLIRVDTVADLYDAAVAAFDDCDWLFAAAAVSDFKPAARSEGKIKKTGNAISVDFIPNTDVLAELGRRKTSQKMIGFAAESDNLLANARGKLERKNLDLIVANDLGNFASSTGKAWLIGGAKDVELPEQEKTGLAAAIVDNALEMLA